MNAIFEQDGKRWHHILDPRSGYPLDNTELDSVTVISRFTDGDIWTTLLYGVRRLRGVAPAGRQFVTKTAT